MKMTLKIDNIYEDGEQVTNTLYDVEVPKPTGGSEALSEWAYDHLFPLTGTGRTEGDAGYFVEIIAAEDPALVGSEFEWGT
jgi:hypothetical protein